MPTTSDRPVRVVMNENGALEVIGGPADVSPEQCAERKAFSTRCGHVKRRLLKGEPMKGKLLEFALDLTGDDGIAAKLKAGQKLDNYQMHLMVDVYLLHARLASR